MDNLLYLCGIAVPYSIIATIIVYLCYTLIDLSRMYAIEPVYIRIIGSVSDKISGYFNNNHVLVSNSNNSQNLEE